MNLRNKIGFWLGIPVFIIVLCMPLSETMTPQAQRTLAVAILMALLWITEAIPIPVTAMIPLIAFPLFRIQPMKHVVSAYGDSNIFLFLGGFFIATTMQRWELHRRIALTIIKIIGYGPQRLILGFMVATAFLSMWISNTATAMMMYPIGLAIVIQIREMQLPDEKLHKNLSNFETALMLSIAYAASIGGIGTLIGTPPNIVFAASVRSLFPQAPPIGFLQWMLIGLPFMLIFTPITWLILVRMVFPVKQLTLTDSKDVIQNQIDRLGRMTKAEKYTLAIFVLTALGWVFRENIALGSIIIPGWSNMLGVEKFVNDATVAIFSAVLLFFIPVNFNEKTFLLNWEWAVKIPWGILILFGGGIALAGGFHESGLAAWIGNNLKFFSQVPILVMIVLTCLILTFLTELTSNTATATIFMPIMAATSLAMGVHPYLLMIPATISVSCAFMLPVATPPNAIIFGSGCVTVPQMAKAGLLLNFSGVIVVTLLVYVLATRVFGIDMGQVPEWIH